MKDGPQERREEGGTMNDSGPELLVQDPYRPYAVRFIELFARRYGIQQH